MSARSDREDAQRRWDAAIDLWRAKAAYDAQSILWPLAFAQLILALGLLCDRTTMERGLVKLYGKEDSYRQACERGDKDACRMVSTKEGR